MNRPLLGRISGYLFVFYVVSYLAFAGYALATFTATAFLPSLRWEYAARRGFVLFMDYLIPVQAAAIAIGVSLTRAEGNRRGQSLPFNRLIVSTLVILVLLAALYTALSSAVYTRMERRLGQMRSQSVAARQYLAAADTARKSKDYRASVEALDRYLAIDKGNDEVESLKQQLEGLAARQALPPPPPAPADLASSEGLDAQAYVEKARYYFDRQDWFSAHYYAQAAATVDPRRVDALRLAAQAWEAISGAGATQADGAGAELFVQKKNAYSLLAGGDFLAAYYRFLQLSAAYPKDKEIANYLQVSTDSLKRVSLFLDEVKQAEPLPGTPQILYLDHGSAAATMAVFVGKMVEMPGGDAYFFDIEALQYDAAGAVAWHFSAPYGRREGSTILMRTVDRTDPKVQYLPLYLQGTRDPAQRALLPLRPTVEELRSLSLDGSGLSSLGFVELWRLRNDLSAFGLGRETLSVDMVMKILLPFAFLVISLFSLALGWGFRTRGAGGIPGPSLILAPLVPIVLAALSLLYLYANRLIVGFAVLAFGLAAAMIVLAALQLILIAVALGMLAGQSTA